MPSQLRVCTARGKYLLCEDVYLQRKRQDRIERKSQLIAHELYLQSNGNCWLSQLTLDFMILRTAFAYKLLLAVQAFALFAGKMNTRSVQTVTEPVLYCPHCNAKLSPSRHSNGGKHTIIPALAPLQLTDYNCSTI